MKLLLINKNPVVSRIINLSASKTDFEVEECANIYALPKGEFEVVIIDEMYDSSFLNEIKENVKYYQIGIITSLKNAAFEEFDFALTKPFLPTDLVELLRKAKAKVEFSKREEKAKVEEIAAARPMLPAKEEQIVEVEEEEEEEPFVSQEEIQEEGGVLDKEELVKVQELLEKEKEEKEKEENKEKAEVKESETKDDSSKEEKAETKEIQEEISTPKILKELNEFQQTEEEKPKLSGEEKIKFLMGMLDLYTIRDLLDGMEVTIRINFNKKKKKRK